MTSKLLIFIVTANTVISMLLLKHAVSEIGGPDSFASWPAFFAKAALSPWVYASLVLQVTGYAIWMVVMSHERLGVAVALSGSTFYVLTALLAWFLYGEPLTPPQWAGIVLISAGVACMTWQSS